MLTGASRRCWIRVRPANPPPTMTTLCCREGGLVGWVDGFICAPVSGCRRQARHGGHRRALRLTSRPFGKNLLMPTEVALSPQRVLTLALLGLVCSSSGLAQSDRGGTDDLRDKSDRPRLHA